MTMKPEMKQFKSPLIKSASASTEPEDENELAPEGGRDAEASGNLSMDRFLVWESSIYCRANERAGRLRNSDGGGVGGIRH